jgi:nucleoside 2-deoxyribosyltransferase
MSKERPKLYLAGPLFTPEQLSVLATMEIISKDGGWEYFSPRLGAASLEMKRVMQAKETPSLELRQAIFNDNTLNIDDADLLIAIIDDRDAGTMWEMGYAYKASVPIVSFTSKGFGMNIMLSQCVIGHAKGFEQLRDILEIYKSAVEADTARVKARAIGEIQAKYLIREAPVEGPKEGKQ